MSIIAVCGVFLALAAAGAAALAGPAYRFGLLQLGDAFSLLRWAAYGGAAACVVSLAGLLRTRPGVPRRGLLPALLGLALGVTVFWLPYSQQRTARTVPPIHDITTDTANPPEFRAVLPLRPGNANSLAYAGEALAKRQHEAYPGVKPARFGAAPGAVFDTALALARDMGWRIVDESRTEGRIEAVDTTFWFGFKDDVVIRVAAQDKGTRVDIRSVSRVGVSDVGKNARRIRQYLRALESRVPPS